MYFCDDVELMGWEPGIFLEEAFAHQAVVNKASGTLTGTALVMAGATLGSVTAGMVGKVELASDDAITQLVEIVSVADASHAVVSGLRGRGGEPAIAPLVGGEVKVTVVSFRPQIAAVGDELLRMIGVASDRSMSEEELAATADLAGFRMAAILGALAMVHRGLAGAQRESHVVLTKLGFYEKAYAGARRGIRGRVDEDGDGAAERAVRGSVGALVRD